MELPFDPAIPVLAIYPKYPVTLIRKNICTPMFILALFTILKVWKQPIYRSGDEWIKKLWKIYTGKYYITVKKKELLPLATAWRDLEIIMVSEIIQLEKDKYHMTSLYVESKKHMN